MASQAIFATLRREPTCAADDPKSHTTVYRKPCLPGGGCRSRTAFGWPH
jgi:hypothetical protein